MKKMGFGARDAVVFGAFVISVCLLALLLSRQGDFSVPVDAPVAITEIMAENGSAWPSGGAYCDWVEIENVSGETVDLSGWKIACGVDTRAACDLGVASLAPGERAVILCAENLSVGFDIPRSGAYLSLVNPAGQTAASVSTPAMDDGQSYARDPETGDWALTYEYTPGLENTSGGYEALLYPEGGTATVVISELMAKNRTTVADGDGNYSDYIELYNTTDAAVDLTGWYLTDEATNRQRQALSGVSVPAGGYALVFLTGSKNSGFALDDKGESVWLVSPDGEIASWARYEELNKDVALTRTASGTYTEDESPTPGYSNSVLGARSARSGGYDPITANEYGIYINELSAAYSTYYDWVELYNSTASALDLSGWGVSDDRDHPRKWQFPSGASIPAGGYVLVCFINDGTEQADTARVFYAEGFSLAFEGSETVCLSTPEGTVVDAVTAAGVSVDVSLGRADGYEAYRYFSAPTPGEANSGATYAKRANEVAFSTDGGMMGDEPIDVTLTAEEGATIYYTLDGSEPGASSYVYTGPIAISQTTVVRARAVCADMLDSYVTARTYVFGQATRLRAVMVSGDASALLGSGGVLNTGEKDDVAVSCEVYDYDGTLMLSQVCRLRMSGHSSRMRLAQKAFTLTAKRVYGTADFDAKLFTNRDATSYDSFVLRASGQDAFQTHMRDSILTSLAEGTGLYYQETELACVYVNGEYWGVYNMREHVSIESIARFEGWDANGRIDFLEGEGYTLAGSRSSYDSILEKVEEVGLESDEMVAELANYVDIDNYLSYVAIQMYAANLDLNNLRAYRNRDADGLWKWMLYDMDLSFQVDKNTPRMWLYDDGAGTITQQDNTLFQELMKNTAVRDRFLTLMGNLLANNLSSQTVVNKIYERYTALAFDMDAQCARWGKSLSTWNSYVKNMVSYAEKRPGKLVGYLTSAFELTDEEVDRYFAAAEAAAEAYVRPGE